MSNTTTTINLLESPMDRRLRLIKEAVMNKKHKYKISNRGAFAKNFMKKHGWSNKDIAKELNSKLIAFTLQKEDEILESLAQSTLDAGK